MSIVLTLDLPNALENPSRKDLDPDPILCLIWDLDPYLILALKKDLDPRSDPLFRSFTIQMREGMGQ